MVGDAFAARDIRVHFDVGDLETYRTIASRCIPDEGETTCTPIPGIVEHPDFVDDYTSHEADAYLITTGRAWRRGDHRDGVRSRDSKRAEGRVPLPRLPGRGAVEARSAGPPGWSGRRGDGT